MRDGKRFSETLPPGEWKVDVRPPIGPEVLSKYLEGKKLIEANDLAKGVTRWQEAASAAGKAKYGKLSCWLLLKTGNALAEARKWDQAHSAYQAAAKAARTTREPAVLAKVLEADAKLFEKQNNSAKAESVYGEAIRIREGASRESLSLAASLTSLGGVALSRGDLNAAESPYKRALDLRQKLAPDSLPLAESLNALGVVAKLRGDLAVAEQLFQRALAITQRLAPGSLVVATSHNNLGNVAVSRGDLAAAEQRFQQAFAITEKLSPGSLVVATSLNNLGNVAVSRGDLAAAEQFHQRALAIKEKLSPGSLTVSASLHNLGGIAELRGDLAAAEQLYQRSLAIKEKLAPESLNVATSLSTLGVVAWLRGDLTTAEQLYQRSLAIMERLAPRSLDVTANLNNLGDVARDRGDLATAEQFHQRALAILEKLAPGSLDVATSLNNLGGVADSRGDLAAAEELYRRSLAIREKLAPGSLDVATSLNNLGNVADSRGDLAVAEQLYQRSLVIYSKLGPGSADEAGILYDLGRLTRRKNDPAAAAEYFRRAIESLEHQKGKLGGSEQVKASFAAKYVDYYRDYIEVLLELNRQRDALGILERSKARSLLAMLAERDLVFASDIPPDLERERKLTDAEYDRAQSQVGELSPQKDAQKIDELLGKLRDLRAKQDEIAEKIKKASPKLASLQYLQPLDLDGTQKALDPGTVLLAYSVGKEKSLLFVVSSDSKRRPPLSVFPLPLSEKALREGVEALRNLIEWKAPSAHAENANFLTRSRSLYDTLIKPAEKLIERSDRILILPDGPLHTLPFDALVRDAKAGKPQYLVEWKPIHTAVSATVYAELKKERRATPSSSPIVVAAFGDPKYPRLPSKKAAAKRSEDEKMEETIPEEEEVSDPQVRSAVRGGYRLDPLPATRQEVESIANLYAPKAVKYLGEEATEEKAKSIGKDTPFIHFACHGILNERFPLDSALALTIPEHPKEGQDNGLLQAWEIFEKVRIDADLVTLSACETGLGKEMGGEGLVGLTRAFQYAGARSILASLWKVEDESTGELMKRFYGYLKAGKTKDEALRSAQIDLIHSPNLAQPSHWAAFQLIGDWK